MSVASTTERRRAPGALRALIIVFCALVAVYLPTSALELPVSIDPQTNALTSYLLAEHGSPVANGYEFTVQPAERIGQTIWLVPSMRGPVSQYPPGAALTAVPFYLLSHSDLFERSRPLPNNFGSDGPLRLPDMWPATATAVLLTAAAMTLFAAVLIESEMPVGYSAAAALVLGLATSMWSVAADALWQHGPAVFFIALTMWALSRERHSAALLSAAMIVLIRPHVAIIVGAIAVGFAFNGRRIRPMISSFTGIGVGVGLLLAYNKYLFGEFSISGGYPDAFLDRLWKPDLGLAVRNFVNAWIASDRGVLVWSPFIAFLLAGAVRAWGLTPIWVRWSAGGGMAYLVVQFGLNRYGGGFDFGFYRYPLEGLMAMAPLGAAAGRQILNAPRYVSFAFRLSIGLAVLAHAFAAFWF